MAKSRTLIHNPKKYKTVFLPQAGQDKNTYANNISSAVLVFIWCHSVTTRKGNKCVLQYEIMISNLQMILYHT